MDPEALTTNRAARELGMAGGEIEIDGTLPEVGHYEIPGMRTSGRLASLLRDRLVRKPVADEDACTLCGECGAYCPAKAITEEGGRLRFDYDACIRCFCCLEVCPRGALRIRESIPARLVRTLVEKNP
jgi:ferredoxin